MIDKKFIDYIGDKLGIEKRNYLEKDILLQILLNELVKNKDFKDNYSFKGGICLIKSYLGYFRFSEDLDFTYLNNGEFKNKSEKQIREMLSIKIDNVANIIKNIADKSGFDFKPDKKNPKYIKFGGSNRFVTFKLWYDSVILNEPSFIKLQINFIEKLNYKIKELPIIFIMDNKNFKEIEILFKDYLYLLNSINIKVYDIKEIFIEKVRAILTRRGIKARDFVDVFLIKNKTQLDLNDFKKEIIEKISPILKFEKYVLNIKNKETQLNDNLILGEEEALMLIPIDKGFPKFLKEFNVFLKEIIKELRL